MSYLGNKVKRKMRKDSRRKNYLNLYGSTIARMSMNDMIVNTRDFYGGGLATDVVPSKEAIGIINDKKFYGGGLGIDKTNSIKHLSADLDQAKSDLKKKRNSLRDKLDEFFKTNDAVDDREVQIESNESFSVVTRKDSDCLNGKDLSEYLEDIDLSRFIISRGMIGMTKPSHSMDYYYDIVREHTEINEAKNLVKALSKQIAFLFSLIKKRLRNLRQVFTKQHSFHFKNLDDYHSSALTSVLVG